MIYKATDIAKFFLSLDKENTVFKLNEDGLQRLNNYLYCAQVNYIAKTGIPLFQDNILATKNGCTIKEVEKHYNELLKQEYETKLPEQDEDFLKRLYDSLEYATNEDIIDLAQSDPAWQQYYVKIEKDGDPLNIIGNTPVCKKCYKSSVRALYE